MRKLRQCLGLILVMFVIVSLMGVPTHAQDDVPIDSPSLMEEFGDFVIEADLLNWTLLLVAVGFLGFSVPQSYIDKQVVAAKASETPLDDIVWQVLAELNKLKMSSDEVIPEAAVASVTKESYADMLTPINDNWNLANTETARLKFGESSIEFPNGWLYYYVLGGGSIHPTIQKIDDGYEMQLDQHIGNFGFEQTLELEAGQAYRVDVQALAQFEGFMMANAHLHCAVYNDHAQENLEPIVINQGWNHLSWAIEPVPSTDTYHVRVWIKTEDDLLADGSALTWRKIAVVKDNA